MTDWRDPMTLTRPIRAFAAQEAKICLLGGLSNLAEALVDQCAEGAPLDCAQRARNLARDIATLLTAMEVIDRRSVP